MKPTWLWICPVLLLGTSMIFAALGEWFPAIYYLLAAWFTHEVTQ